MADLAFDDGYSFAGFMLAHAIWSIDGSDEVLTTMLAILGPQGAPSIMRLDSPSIPEALEAGRRMVEEQADARAAVLIYDGYAPVDGERTDALIGELTDYREPEKSAAITLAYARDAGSTIRIVREGFHVSTGGMPGDAEVQAFFEGIGRHGEAAEIWRRGSDGEADD